MKLTSFYSTMETINKMRRQPMDWQKIFTNDATNKGLISKIYKHKPIPVLVDGTQAKRNRVGVFRCAAFGGDYWIFNNLKTLETYSESK